MPDPFTVTQTGIAAIDFVIKQGTCLYKYLKRNYGYVNDMSNNYNKLMREYKELCEEEEEVKGELERNELENEKIIACEPWFQEVVEMKNDVPVLQEKYNRSFSCMWTGLGPFCCLAKLGGLIVEKTEKIMDLKVEGGNIRSSMVQNGPAPYITNPTNKISKFSSLEENVKKLSDYLIAEDLKRICILGPIGIGKSTLMNRFHQTMKGSIMFARVFFIKVGIEGNEANIQEQLLRRLGVRPEELSYEERKGRIHKELKNQSYLLLLDEVFSKIDWEEIGINDDHRGKIVFATRYRDVCESDEEIEVQRLSDTDAEDMFWEKVGVHLKDNGEIKREAELIIKFCSGYPYQIKLIGNYLAKKARVRATNGTNPAIWRDTWDELSSPTGEAKQDLEEFYRSLKLEVDGLPEEKKCCFLYLAIFPAGHELHRDYIIECWRAQQFLKPSKYKKLGKARDRESYTV